MEPTSPFTADAKTHLFLRQQRMSFFSADRRIAFSQFRPETLKATINPENPVDPVQKRSLAEKTIEDVLLHFGETKRVAIKRYQEFVEKGINRPARHLPAMLRNAR